MNIVRSDIPEVIILEPKMFGDERGYFYESYNERDFASKVNIETRFVQDNHSRSAKNVLRGLHYQIRQAQGKLVCVTAGEIYDVAVDIRRSSATFGKWVAHILSDKHRQMLWVPPGFAHGFLVTSDYAEVQYKTTDFWAPEFERSIIWNDPDIGIDWPLAGAPVLAAKDQAGRPLKEAEVFE